VLVLRPSSGVWQDNARLPAASQQEADELPASRILQAFATRAFWTGGSQSVSRAPTPKSNSLSFVRRHSRGLTG
jgi:hypothetical protein